MKLFVQINAFTSHCYQESPRKWIHTHSISIYLSFMHFCYLQSYFVCVRIALAIFILIPNSIYNYTTVSWILFSFTQVFGFAMKRNLKSSLDMHVPFSWQDQRKNTNHTASRQRTVFFSNEYIQFYVVLYESFIRCWKLLMQLGSCLEKNKYFSKEYRSL